MNERELFQEALDRANPTERQTFLDQACAGDTALRARIEALLTSHSSQSQFLNVPIMEQLRPPAATDDCTVTVDGSKKDDSAAEDTRDDDAALGFLTSATRAGSLGRIGHYEVLQVLGKGGFGIVFRAFDDTLQRVVAIKVMAPHMAATSPARKRFLREARTSAQVRHENVVQVYEVAEHPLPYLAMEFIPGETLQQRLDRSGPLEVPEILRVGRQIAEGLAAAHATDLIHRDIKPGNILLEGGAQKVKITDFGLARTADDASISQSGIIAGTPMFMAPEQALGHTLDQRADLFSLGSVLYQMATGRPPFRATGTLAVLKRVAEDTPRPIRETIPETPQWLCDIIAKLHAKNPDDRFQSAREVADVLADCEAQLKANSRLKDFSKIPVWKRPDSRRSTGKRVAIMGLIVFTMAGFIALAASLFFRTPDPKPNDNPKDNPNVAVQGQPFQPPDVTKNEPPLAVAPFDAVQAKAHQEDWAKHLGVPVEYTNSIGMTFRLIPPGEFTMGTSIQDLTFILKSVPEWARANVQSEAPARPVRIAKPFYLAATEVTVGQFKQFVAATGYRTQAETNGTGGEAWTGKNNQVRAEFTWRHPNLTLTDSHPVGQLCPADAEMFCSWLQKSDGRIHRIPDEEQWEFACRAGTATRWSCEGDNDTLKQHGLKGWDLAFTGRAVGQRPANPFGLFDVHGNLEEMCRTKDGAYVNRGGRSGTDCFLVRSANRATVARLRTFSAQGFRVAILGNLKPTLSPAPELVAMKESHAPTFKNGVGMEFVKVPKGKSWLGGGAGKPGDKEVEMPTDFYLGKYEVTQEEWEKVMAGANPSFFSRKGNGKDSVKDVNDDDLKRFPVDTVSWDQCQLFLTQLNKQAKEPGWVYRLPTEIEWEYACRGGPNADRAESAFDYYIAKPMNALTAEQANFNSGTIDDFIGLNRICKVGSYEPNPLGLYDMHGNQWEWCNDAGTNFDGTPGYGIRGGSWGSPADECTAAFRGTRPQTNLSQSHGFRVARVPSGAPSSGAKAPPLAVAPFTEAKRVAALPAEQQVEEVRKELMRLNAKFDGTLTPTIKEGVVVGLRFQTGEVSNIAPVQALKGLTTLECGGNSKNKGKLSDLTPLKGMVLTSVDLSFNQVRDLEPLKGMPLTLLSLGYSQVRDLSPLKGMKLETLNAQAIPSSDLAPLEGMPIKHLDLHRAAGVTNLQPLQGMPLTYLNLSHLTVSDLSILKGMASLEQLALHDMERLSDLKPLEGLKLKELDLLRTAVTDLSPVKGMELKLIVLPPVEDVTHGLDTLRDMESLAKIGIDHGKLLPTAEFWKRYDKGEYKE